LLAERTGFAPKNFYNRNLSITCQILYIINDLHHICFRLLSIAFDDVRENSVFLGGKVGGLTKSYFTPFHPAFFANRRPGKKMKIKKDTEGHAANLRKCWTWSPHCGLWSPQCGLHSPALTEFAKKNSPPRGLHILIFWAGKKGRETTNAKSITDFPTE